MARFLSIKSVLCYIIVIFLIMHDASHGASGCVCDFGFEQPGQISADCIFTGHQPSENMRDASLESSVACAQL